MKVEYEQARCELNLIDTTEGRMGFVTDFWVPPKHRRKGWGVQLIELIMKAAKEENCEQVCMCCHQDNTPALRLYLKAGFTHCGFGLIKKVE